MKKGVMNYEEPFDADDRTSLEMVDEAHECNCETPCGDNCKCGGHDEKE